MKRLLLHGLAALALLAAPARAGEIAPTAPMPQGDGDEYEWVWYIPDWAKGRFSVGTRMTYYTLLDDSRSLDDSFIGNITTLDATQDLMPWKLYLAYDVTPNFGVELTWDDLEVDLVNGTGLFQTDGTAHLFGPILTVVGRWPNGSAFTPSLGLGLAYWSADFESENWWHYGYNSEAEYNAYGRPHQYYAGKSRDMDLDGAIGLVVTLGVEGRLSEHWSLDVYMRYAEADVTDVYELSLGGQTQNRSEVTLPLEHLAFGLGLKYLF